MTPSSPATTAAVLERANEKSNTLTIQHGPSFFFFACTLKNTVTNMAIRIVVEEE